MNRLTLSLSLSTLGLYNACTGTISDEAERPPALAGAEHAGAGSAADAPHAHRTEELVGTSAALSAPAAPFVPDAALAASVNAPLRPWFPTQPMLYRFKFAGPRFTLLKNWLFGAAGNIRNYDDLSREFQYHDQFGTIANGSNYGAVTVAADSQTAVSAPGLGLPDDRQPIDNPARPFREFTAKSMLAHVRPLSRLQTSGSTRRHDVGNGSIVSKWALPKGGSALGHDIVWETRVRMPTTMRGYWFALWTSGNRWNAGAEMDVVESFGTQYVKGDAFHADAVGGTSIIDFRDWYKALRSVGVPDAKRQLSAWHTWTWVYKADDTYAIYYDQYLVQKGTIHWTLGGAQAGEPLDMRFLFDFSWGHTQVSEVNVDQLASAFQLSYEIAYSRVWIR